MRILTLRAAFACGIISVSLRHSEPADDFTVEIEVPARVLRVKVTHTPGGKLALREQHLAELIGGALARVVTEVNQDDEALHLTFGGPLSGSAGRCKNRPADG